jgi:hypothetical protein
LDTNKIIKAILGSVTLLQVQVDRDIAIKKNQHHGDGIAQNHIL